jgi:hypothetical protein
VDQVNYTAQKAWKELRFVMCVLKKGNKNTKSLAYTSLLRPILEYGSACWDTCKEGHVNALDRVRKKAAQFTNLAKYSDLKTLVSVERQHAYAQYLKRTLRSGLGKLYTTSCAGVTI